MLVGDTVLFLRPYFEAMMRGARVLFLPENMQSYIRSEIVRYCRLHRVSPRRLPEECPLIFGEDGPNVPGRRFSLGAKVLLLRNIFVAPSRPLRRESRAAEVHSALLTS